MEGAEKRFGQLASQADDAQRVAETMAQVTDVGRRDGAPAVEWWTSRCAGSRAAPSSSMSCEERIRLLGQELEQRQGALDKATEHLTRASTLRQEAAETAQRLEEVNTARRRLAGQGGAAGRTARPQMAGELETRADALKTVERQLTTFEGLLDRWESAQREAAKALEQTLARQGAVEALEAQVKHVFDLAESAVDHVQAIGSARRGIEETRAILIETQAQFAATEAALQDFDARKRQLERAEQRLARAEALAMGIRSTVESLQAQRIIVDHAMESAGALTLQMKQAEALIQALRRERQLACDLKAALDGLEVEEGEAGEE